MKSYQFTVRVESDLPLELPPTTALAEVWSPEDPDRVLFHHMVFREVPAGEPVTEDERAAQQQQIRELSAELAESRRAHRGGQRGW